MVGLPARSSKNLRTAHVSTRQGPMTSVRTHSSPMAVENPAGIYNRSMCGRYKLSRRKQIIEERFDVPPGEAEEWAPRYNIAPTQSVPVIRQHPKEPRRVMNLMRWGLVPAWAKDLSDSARRINARSETAATLPAFREAFQHRRCLVPADGFYEWQRAKGSKQPYCFEVNGGELFAFAGLWERWKEPSGAWLKSFSILTTTPNAVTSGVHDRMPVILDRADYDLWLDPGMTKAGELVGMLRPLPAELMRSYPVSSRVNHVANDDEACAVAVEAGAVPAQTSLF